MQPTGNGTDSSLGAIISKRKIEGGNRSPGKSIKQSRKMREELDLKNIGQESMMKSIDHRMILKGARAIVGVKTEGVEERLVPNSETDIGMSTTQRGRERHPELDLEIYLGIDRVDRTDKGIEDTEKGALVVIDIEKEI